MDIVIVGGGPAALTASIYASRYGVKNLVIGKAFGGEMANAHLMQNYPGYEKISGAELSQKIRDHADSYDKAELKQETVKEIVKNNKGFKVTTDSNEYEAKTVILAHGTQRRKLKIPGEEEFIGKGVSYCATCDGPLFRNKIVGVVGGGNAAVTAAIMLTEYASKVYLIMIEKEAIAEEVWIQKMKENDKIEVIYETSVVKVDGEGLIKEIELNKNYKESKKLSVGGLFVEIGSEPDKFFIESLKLETGFGGKIKVTKRGETNIPGLYAAGDVCDMFNEFAQVILAEASGAAAAYGAYNYLKTEN